MPASVSGIFRCSWAARTLQDRRKSASAQCFDTKYCWKLKSQCSHTYGDGTGVIVLLLNRRTKPSATETLLFGLQHRGLLARTTRPERAKSFPIAVFPKFYSCALRSLSERQDRTSKSIRARKKRAAKPKVQRPLLAIEEE